MTRAGWWGVWLGVSLAGLSPAWAANPSLKECKNYGMTGPTARTTLSTQPSKLCSMECFATAANGIAVAWDTPGDNTHAQAKVMAEPGAATANTIGATGQINRFSQFGIYIETRNCIATYSWDE